MNPFEVLGIEPRLLIEQEELNASFRQAGKSAHPDAGGSEQGFAQLQAAVNLIQSPASRLKAWLELRGIEVEARGSIGSELMDEFGQVGEVMQKAEVMIRKREAAHSALAKAMLENETQLCRESIEEAIARIGGLIEGICSNFKQLEQAEAPEPVALEWHRDLKFFEKWQASLRALYGRLL